MTDEAVAEEAVGEKASLIDDDARQALTAARDRIRAEYLFSREHRPPTTGRGIHHTALICRDVETTVEWYQNVAGFPVTVLFENRDLAGSTHFFFDVGNGNCLAFFDLPGVQVGPYAEVLGGLHHLAISVPEQQWHEIRARLDERDIPYAVHSGSSIYTTDPDGARIEFLHDPLGEMYGKPTV
jgi:catechol 2,3-dioxygenase-like lactoylglutathione lyase family enzyme